MGEGRLGSETEWWDEEQGLDMRVRRKGGRITYGIKRLAETCFFCILLYKTRSPNLPGE